MSAGEAAKAANRRMWQRVVAVVFALLVLAAMLVFWSSVKDLNAKLTHGTEPGNQTRALICQSIVNDGQALPAICYDPDVSKYLVAPASEIPGTTQP